MKIVLTGHIDAITRSPGSERFTTDDDWVRILLDMTGCVEGAGRSEFTGTLKIKPKTANQLRFGEKLTITIEDDTEKVIELTDADIISIEENQ